MTPVLRGRLAMLGLLALLAATGTDLQAATDGWIEVVGRAHDLDDDRLLYVEQHRILRRQGLPVSHTVSYRDPDGVEIAFKTVDYARSIASPAFELRDHRDGYREGARFTDDGRYRLFRQEPGQPLEEQEIEFDEHLVTDAGFDAYVRKHLATMSAGKRVAFRLGLPGVLRTFDFRARRTGIDESNGRAVLKIRVEPDSLLRLVVDPLDLVYAIEPVQLLEFRGRTNIRNAKGGRYDARIVFGPESPADGPMVPNAPGQPIDNLR